MTFNMDWLRAIIDKLYIYLSGLSDYELFKAFLFLIIFAVEAWIFLPEIPNLIRYLNQKRKSKKASQRASQAAGTTPNTASGTATLPAYGSKTSNCTQSGKTLSASVPRASSAKPELDIEELKRLLDII